MIIGISGKKQSGKNTVALIWQYLYDYYNNNYTHPITEEDFKEYVKNNHHLKSVWIQKSFAHKIKQIICILLGCTMEQLEDPIFKETPLGEEWWCWKIVLEGGYGTHLYPYSLPKPKNIQGLNLVKMTPRMLMQMLGTEFGRDMVHPNLWVNALMNEYKRQKWLVTDVRFFNEAKAIKDRGGILIRVNRDFTPKEGDEIQIKVFSNWSKVLYSHTDNNGYHYGYGSDGYKYKSTLIRPITDNHFSETALDSYQDWDYVIDNNYSLLELILRVRQIMFKEGIIYE
jgi:hypothetical protein